MWSPLTLSRPHGLRYSLALSPSGFGWFGGLLLMMIGVYLIGKGAELLVRSRQPRRTQQVPYALPDVSTIDPTWLPGTCGRMIGYWGSDTGWPMACSRPLPCPVHGGRGDATSGDTNGGPLLSDVTCPSRSAAGRPDRCGRFAFPARCGADACSEVGR